eukprot:3438-Heterococcus_DN1.PRE.5
MGRALHSCSNEASSLNYWSCDFILDFGVNAAPWCASTIHSDAHATYKHNTQDTHIKPHESTASILPTRQNDLTTRMLLLRHDVAAAFAL